MKKVFIIFFGLGVALSSFSAQMVFARGLMLHNEGISKEVHCVGCMVGVKGTANKIINKETQQSEIQKVSNLKEDCDCDIQKSEKKSGGDALLLASKISFVRNVARGWFIAPADKQWIKEKNIGFFRGRAPPEQYLLRLAIVQQLK